MIGHTFSSSGAVTLAVAPSPRLGDYLVLARYEDQYVVANLYVDRLIEADGHPDHWMDGAYFQTLDAAVEDFGVRTGLLVDKIAEQVRYADRRVTAKDGAR